MLVPRSHSPPMARLQHELDQLFEQFFGDYEPFRAWDPLSLRRYPAVNVWEDESRVFVEAELPGLTEQDVELTVTGDELAMKGAHPAPATPEGTVVHRRERATNAFSRVVRLPAPIDHGRVEASFRNGVLTVALGKADVARPRRIPVKTSSG